MVQFYFSITFLPLTASLCKQYTILHKYCRLLFYYYKIAGDLYLLFFNYAYQTKYMVVYVLHCLFILIIMHCVTSVIFLENTNPFLITLLLMRLFHSSHLRDNFDLRFMRNGLFPQLSTK